MKPAHATVAAEPSAAEHSPAEPPVGGVPGVRVPTVSWSDAGEGYQEATVEVPYDYAQPQGRTFPLYMVRLPAADPARKLGTLFVNFGGPGGPAASTVRQSGRSLLPAAVLARYDLVGVDPRGTGRSRQVQCLDTVEEQSNYPYVFGATYPRTRAEYAEAASQARRLAARCARRNGDLLRHVGTLPFARDLDVLRAALGDRKINLLGLSYGSFLGQVVARTFPTRTGALVLDSVVDPAWAAGRRETVSWSRSNSDAGSAETLNRYLELCAAAGPQRCAFAAGGSPRRKFARLTAELRRRPLPVSLPDGTSVHVDDRMLISATISGSGLYAMWMWPLVAELHQAAYLRDAAAVADVAAQMTPPPDPAYDHYLEASAAIACGDTDNPRNPDRYRRLARQRDATVAPYTAARWINFALPCASWRARASERLTGPWTTRTSAPVLLLNTTYDPATPHRGAQRVSRLMPNSRLLTVDGVGHGAFFLSSCATQAVARYLLSGATPKPGQRCRQDFGPFDPLPGAAAAERRNPTYESAPMFRGRMVVDTRR